MKKLLTLFAVLITVTCFTSCDQPSGSKNTGFTSQSVPGLSAERISTTSSGDAVYMATDADDFKNALDLSERFPIREIIYTGTTEMQGNFISTNPISKELRIRGARINGSFSRALPRNQNQAVDSAGNWYQVKYFFENCSFTGSGSNGINMNCSYIAIRDCNFNGKDTSINVTFCMNAQIINNQVINSKKGGICLNVGTNKWLSAGNSTSASNHPYFEGNRIFNMEGAEFGLACFGVSGPYIQNHISEGKRPQYHIIINDLNSTTVWNSAGNNIHLESAATLAGILIKSRQGISDWTAIYPQYAMTLIDAQSYAGAVQVNVSNLCWIPSGSKFASTGNIRYRFKDLYNTVRADTSTMWVNAKFPNVLCQENLTASGLVVKNYVNGKRQ